MKEKLKIMGLMATMSAMISPSSPVREFYPEDIEPAKPVIPKGHKSFWVEGVEVYALNRKNAEKKFKKFLQNQK